MQIEEFQRQHDPSHVSSHMIPCFQIWKFYTSIRGLHQRIKQRTLAAVFAELGYWTVVQRNAAHVLQRHQADSKARWVVKPDCQPVPKNACGSHLADILLGVQPILVGSAAVRAHTLCL